MRTKGRDVEGEIGSVYRAVDADPLVMGVYSRHRFRERLFEGVTEYMLLRTEIPAFMLHR